jgi:hypothetical protein
MCENSEEHFGMLLLLHSLKLIQRNINNQYSEVLLYTFWDQNSSLKFTWTQMQLNLLLNFSS